MKPTPGSHGLRVTGCCQPSSPRPSSQVSGQWSVMGGQAFSISGCMACGSHSQYSASRYLGFFFQAASKASRQSAFSATRARRRLSVRGCSLAHVFSMVLGLDSRQLWYEASLRKTCPCSRNRAKCL